MARRPSEQQVFDELLDRYGQEIAAAFMAAMDDLRSAADLQRILTAIEAGNIEAAIAAMHLDAAAYGALLDAIGSAYSTGGTTAVAYLPTLKDAAGAAFVVRFNARNPRAENWLRDHSSTLVTRILDDQRAAVRQALTAGMERGDNPRRTALDIVGRVNKATGKREGGVLGLTAAQEGYARNAAAELASGDPEALKAYLGRARRDKRFDRSVLKAIREEKPLPADIQAKALARYKDRLLALRGEMIGRTESLTALRAAKHESYLQAVESGAVRESAIRRTWQSAGDLRVRHTHQGLHGDTTGLREPFVSPSGARLLYPGDTSLGAPASETIGCRCDLNYRIDFLSNLR